MPATEQTWRNLKTLHVAFGASASAETFVLAVAPGAFPPETVAVFVT